MFNDMPLVSVLMFQQSALPMPAEEMVAGFLAQVTVAVGNHHKESTEFSFELNLLVVRKIRYSKSLFFQKDIHQP